MIIIEDGSLTEENANSFVSLVDYRAYAALAGVNIEEDDATAEQELIKAARFLKSKEPRLKGYPVDRDQPLPYPRTNLVINNFAWSDDEIPRHAILCQLNLALDIRAGVDPFNPPANRVVKKEKVDVVEVEYFGDEKQVDLTRHSSWQAFLSELSRNNGLRIAFTRVL